MGKIKSKIMRRTSNSLIEKGVPFNEDFETNKKILGDTMPSKKLRNRTAGLISRLKRQEAKKKEQLAVK